MVSRRSANMPAASTMHIFVRNMPRQAFRNHELLTRCPYDGSQNLAPDYIQLFWNGHLHTHGLGGRPGRPLDRIVVGKYLFARFAVGSSHIQNLYPSIHGNLQQAAKNSVYTEPPFESCIAIPCQHSRRMLKKGQISHPPNPGTPTCHLSGRGPSDFLCLSWREWPRLPFTARIERYTCSLQARSLSL